MKYLLYLIQIATVLSAKDLTQPSNIVEKANVNDGYMKEWADLDTITEKINKLLYDYFIELKPLVEKKANSSFDTFYPLKYQS
eukprot:UN04222